MAKSGIISSQMNADYNGFLARPKGESSAIGGGTMTSNGDGTASYTNSSGVNSIISGADGANAIGAANPEIAKAWHDKYGYNQPVAGTKATTAMSSYSPAVSSAATSPTSWNVDPNNMTVQGQLKGILDPNNPLMQQAQTTGLQLAGDRGLINSSMAQTGAQDAMLKSAVPIATADATMYGKSASENASNATSMSNAATSASATLGAASIGANASMANAKLGAETDIYRADTTNATTLATNKANNDTTLADSKLRTDAAAALGLQDTQTRSLIQGSASATSLMNNYTHQLASVLKDPSYTTPEARDAARDQLLNSTKAAIQMVGALSGNQDIAAYMDALFPE